MRDRIDILIELLDDAGFPDIATVLAEELQHLRGGRMNAARTDDMVPTWAINCIIGLIGFVLGSVVGILVAL